MKIQIKHNYIYIQEEQFIAIISRTVGRSENPGVPVLFGGHDLPTLVETGMISTSDVHIHISTLFTSKLFGILLMKALQVVSKYFYLFGIEILMNI